MRAPRAQRASREAAHATLHVSAGPSASACGRIGTRYPIPVSHPVSLGPVPTAWRTANLLVNRHAAGIAASGSSAVGILCSRRQQVLAAIPFMD